MGEDVVSAEFKIYLFGKLRLEIGGQSIERFHTRTVGWIFAYLVLQRGRKVRREDLLEALWPDAKDPETTRQTFRRQLTHLRKALGKEAHRLEAPEKTSLRLNLEGAEVDLFAFEAALSKGNSESAVFLYGGDLLQDCGATWIMLHREQCRVCYQEALRELAQKALQEQHPEQALPYLKRSFQENRAQEDIALALMGIYYERQAYLEAIDVFRELRSELARHYDACPHEKTTALYRTILKTSLEQKRVSEGQRAATAEPCGSVPEMLVPLIGRGRAVSEILSRLEKTPLITLTGQGGIGKSQMALQIAHIAWPDYADGVWFVDLLQVSTPELLTSEIAAVLKLSAAEEPNEQMLVRCLKTQRLLLILDNCEHLMPDCTKLVRALLQNCPHLRILATSRQALRLRGEQNWRVSPLPLPPLPPSSLWEEPDPDALLEKFLTYDAGALFVDRAQRAWHEFALTPANARAITRICHRLEGIPLAIDLAAVWVGEISLELLEGNLEDRFSMLTEGDPSGPSHHQTLRTMLDWSYDAFEEPEQRLWQAVSLLTGEWDREAAEALCEGFVPQLSFATHIQKLVDHSIVLPLSTEQDMGYRMLETLRDYGRERLGQTPEIAARLQTRQLDYCVALARRLTPAFREGNIEGIRRMNRARGDFRSALDWAEKMRLAESGLLLASALWPLWNLRGEYSEGYRCLETMLHLASESDPLLRLKAIGAAGNLAYRSGDYTNARRWFQAHIDLACALERPQAMAAAFGNLGNLATQENRLEEAKENFERCLALFEQMEDSRGAALALSNMAIIACRQKDFVRAYRWHEDSLTRFREKNDRLNLATALANFGETRFAAGERAAAVELLTESLRISHEIGYMRSVAQCLCLYLSLSRSLALTFEAGMLLGISEIWREGGLFSVSEQVLGRFEEDRIAVSIGLEPDRFEQAIRQGRALEREETIEWMIALGDKILSATDA